MKFTKENAILTGIFLALASGVVGALDGYDSGGIATGALWAVLGAGLGFGIGVVLYIIRTGAVHYFFVLCAIAFIGGLAYVAVFE